MAAGNTLCFFVAKEVKAVLCSGEFVASSCRLAALVTLIDDTLLDSAAGF